MFSRIELIDSLTLAPLVHESSHVSKNYIQFLKIVQHDDVRWKSNSKNIMYLVIFTLVGEVP